MTPARCSKCVWKSDGEIEEYCCACFEKYFVEKVPSGNKARKTDAQGSDSSRAGITESANVSEVLNATTVSSSDEARNEQADYYARHTPNNDETKAFRAGWNAALRWARKNGGGT